MRRARGLAMTVELEGRVFLRRLLTRQKDGREGEAALLWRMERRSGGRRG